ncbi:hypothetical protein D3C84_826230 [compost metagenome]
MFGLDHHGDTGGVGDLLHGFGDLPGEVFLDLQAAGVHVDDPRHLRQPQHLAGGDVGHMRLADKGQQMVFAQRIEFDVLDDDHFVIVGGEQCAVDHFFQAFLVAVTQVLHGLGRALGGIQQTFALGILTHANQDFTKKAGQFLAH